MAMQICRACGQSLYDRTEYESLEKYATTYSHLTAIQLFDENLALLKVCYPCIQKLNDFDDFRKICLQVHWRLHNVKVEITEEEVHQETIVEVTCKPEYTEDLLQKQKQASDAADFSDDDDAHEDKSSDDDDFDEDDNKPLSENIMDICHFEQSESSLVPEAKRIKSEFLTDEEEAIVSKPKKKRAKWGSLKKPEPREPMQIYSCDRCPKKFRVVLRLNAHKRTHDGLKPFECELCGKDFAKWHNLKTHRIQKHTDDKISIPCEHPGCGQAFATRQGLKRHRLRTHDPNYVLPEPMVFICDTCGKTFSSNGALKKHKYIHAPNEMPFVCKICAKKFPTSHKLKEHTMRHEGVKNHTCPYCGLRKTTMHELRTHMNNVHSKLRSYPCDICASVFSNIGNLNRHVKIVHLGLKPYTCQVCERSFGKSDHLKRHMRSHNIPISAHRPTNPPQQLMDLEPTPHVQVTTVTEIESEQITM